MAEDTIIQGKIPMPQRDGILMLEAGYFLLEMRQYPQAEQVFQGLAALAPHSEMPLIALGGLYHAMGHFGPCLKAHEKAAAINPQSGTAYAGMGEALMFLDRFDEALKVLDKAIDLDPEGPAALFAAALKDAHNNGVFTQSAP